MDTQPPRIALDRYDQSWYSRGRSVLVVLLWEVVQMTVIHCSLLPMYRWRRFWYRLFGARIALGVRLRRTVSCTYPWNLEIGENCWISDGVTLYCLERITIGRDVVISQQSYLCSGTHDHLDPHFGLIVKPITIGHSVWVALGVMIMPGVTVGDGAVISSRSVVTRDARAWTIYRGSPAVAIGPRELRSVEPPLPTTTG